MDPADGGKLIYFDFGARSIEKLRACYPLTQHHEVCKEVNNTRNCLTIQRGARRGMKP